MTPEVCRPLPVDNVVGDGCAPASEIVERVGGSSFVVEILNPVYRSQSESARERRRS